MVTILNAKLIHRIQEKEGIVSIVFWKTTHISNTSVIKKTIQSQVWGKESPSLNEVIFLKRPQILVGSPWTEKSLTSKVTFLKGARIQTALWAPSLNLRLTFWSTAPGVIPRMQSTRWCWLHFTQHQTHEDHNQFSSTPAKLQYFLLNNRDKPREAYDVFWLRIDIHRRGPSSSVTCSKQDNGESLKVRGAHMSLFCLSFSHWSQHESQ